MQFPTLFISHGSPMHALDAGGAGKAWAAIAASMPRPRAVLMVSAHWETSLPMLTGARQLQTIHDFGGFAPSLYEINYPVSGHPLLARRALELLEAAGWAPQADERRRRGSKANRASTDVSIGVVPPVSCSASESIAASIGSPCACQRPSASTV